MLRARLDAGGRLIALGNGGSATDAMDVVADFRTPMFGGPPRRALDLTEDTGIITAVANDIGTDAIFLRQVIAYGREGDVLLALSTSGNSLSILEALREGRKRKMVTMAFVGYDGGNVAKNELADHVFISRSENIPRIQEAHASGYHVLRELVELVAPEAAVSTSAGALPAARPRPRRRHRAGRRLPPVRVPRRRRAAASPAGCSTTSAACSSRPRAPPEVVEAFVARLRDDAPPLADVRGVDGRGRRRARRAGLCRSSRASAAAPRRRPSRRTPRRARTASPSSPTPTTAATAIRS